MTATRRSTVHRSKGATMGRECPHCDRWLSAGDLIEGYCWDCKREVPISDD